MATKQNQQKRNGILAGKAAAEGALKLGYIAWLHRQINQCHQLAPTYPYAAGYVVGAMEVINRLR